MTTNSLDNRIADAFAVEHSSADLTSLLDEVRSAATAATVEQVEADRVALDPATRPEAVREAREASGDATFRAARFTKAIEGLSDLLAKARQREQKSRNLEEYRAAGAERDQLARDIVDQYPKLSAQLADLMGRIVRSNSRCEQASRLGLGHLQRAELEARPQRNNPSGLPVVELVNGVRLPHFDMIHGRPDQWPPSSRL